MPAYRFYGGNAVRPFEARGKEVSETSSFLERFGEMRFEEGERLCFGSAEKIEGEGREELKRDHRGNGISGEAEDGFVLADGKDRWFAGADGDRVEVKVGAKIAEDFFDEVVLSRRNAAGKDEHTVLEALRDFVV